ncbi:MAG: UDP-N-acetylglucosamine 2-epimerase (non-hydrolyzing) [Flavobacteriales bacterium]|nr:UDP-N-acetylglucosamine 2-epimerase (non-hydrolyzing) [Flavobacteriales bacterium]
MKKVLISVGTRPNIIKITQFKRLSLAMGMDVKILHTGQHYDHQMAQVFYDQFGVQPDFRKELRSGTTLEQITQIMYDVTEVIEEVKPDILLTPGDVNSTFAAAYAAYHAKIPVGHIESGLRSHDLGMPEEINRMLTDEITDHYFITERSGEENLEHLGKDTSRLHMVGNTMIDTLVAFDEQIDASTILSTAGVTGEFALATFHRPSNVDDRTSLEHLVALIDKVSARIPLVFPVHPRTRKALAGFSLLDRIESNKNVFLLDPLGYFDFQKLVKEARFVLTDSGGIQEETTFRQVPCLTLRPNTERPITIDMGTNKLLDFDVDNIIKEVDQILGGNAKKGQVPPLWDGKATERILQVLKNL